MYDSVNPDVRRGLIVSVTLDSTHLQSAKAVHDLNLRTASWSACAAAPLFNLWLELSSRLIAVVLKLQHSLPLLYSPMYCEITELPPYMR